MDPSSTIPTEHARTADLVRQVTVLVGSLVAIAGALVGSGAAGGESQTEVGDGALAADATLVAPAGPAFSIWSVIYTGLLAYAVWQALPSRRTDARQRRVGWLVLASMVLNAAWIAVVQADALVWSVPVIVALLVVLAVVHVRLVASRASGLLERVVLDGTLGLYLGWVCVATVANVAAVLTAEGLTVLALGPEAWAAVVLAVAALVGIGLAVHGRGRLAIGAAIAWGLAWIAVARSTGEPTSLTTAVAAATAAAAVVIATLMMRLRRDEDAGVMA
ncbi:tryptophan-rich sensory protein [Cellulomonas carbonis]|uniref:Membrane protein n=1 Tax=Cellulomonas carbonis T26 TaxID=947969 RepID=A0A0A0BTK9_9CELL|nr:tryptophan-rich sensory protein [Cellulomonas carbonis]KGM11236.1 membrane protein [Cellulomonas carbonis T26]GGC10951.1 tryptophan-rich sensory protein [Cellulomonas carbonis]